MKDLDTELCSPKFVAEPIDPVRVSARPLKRETVRLNESVNDLYSEECSTEIEDVVRETIRFFA